MAGSPKKSKAGRKSIYGAPMGPTAIKLPAEQVEWLNRSGNASKSLRSILTRLIKYGSAGVLPPDPGPGVTVRKAYAVERSLLDQVKKYGRGRGYTVAIRRAIVADMAGILPKNDK
jgi:hypothetical protein